MAGEEKATIRGFPGGVALHGVWQDPAVLKPLFADQMQVTRIGDVFHLTFGQVQVILGKQAPGTKTPIDPVARVVVSEEGLSRMADLLEKVRKDWGMIP